MNEPGFLLTLLAILVGAFVGATGSFLGGRSQAKLQARLQWRLRRVEQQEDALIELLPMLRAARDAVRRVTLWNDEELLVQIDTEEKERRADELFRADWAAANEAVAGLQKTWEDRLRRRVFDDHVDRSVQFAHFSWELPGLLAERPPKRTDVNFDSLLQAHADFERAIEQTTKALRPAPTRPSKALLNWLRSLSHRFRRSKRGPEA